LPLSNPAIREHAVERDNYSIGNNETLPYNVEYTLAQVIYKETLIHSNIEYELLKLFNRYDYNVQSAFKAIDIKHTRYISFEFLSKYLTKMKIEAKEIDVVAFIRRMDRDLDGKISFSEFSELFRPCSTKRVKPNYITPTKSFQAGIPSDSILASLIVRSPSKEYKNSAVDYSNIPRNGNKVLSTGKSSVYSYITSPYKGELSDLHSKISTIKNTKGTLKRAKTPGSSKERHSSLNIINKNELFTLLKQQIKAEEEIETLRQNIILSNDLTLPKVWAIFDPKGKGSIQVSDLAKSLESLGIEVEEESVFLLFNRLDLDMDGLWKANDMENLIIPAEKDYEELIASKIERHPNKKLRKETLDLLKRLLKVYIKGEVDNESYKKSLGDLDERRVFNGFDINNMDFFSLAEVSV